ncbi:chemotaxis protein methyltransferase [Azoarcus sp. CIB]|nr:chemotaxis protein methyltransferase [Azoarcus sp. CIB]
MPAGDSPFGRKPATPVTAARTTADVPARLNFAANSAPGLAAMAAAAAASALSASGEREFELTSADFERIRKLIYDHAGIVLSPAKQDMVYSRLARRLRACGDRSFAQYIGRLERDRTEWETFVNSLTTNLTSFFREAHHFDILAERMRRVAERRTLRIWCNAASTGEEPYSLAITACEAFNTLSPPVQIIASDIDTSVLAHAERGVYRDDRVARISPEMLRRYFEQGAGLASGEHRVRPELKRLLTFRRINLLDAVWPVQGPLDAIFCRNVMIYFDKTTQYGILKRFGPLLRKDGALFAGHSESFMHAGDLFRSTGRTVYQRTDADGN